MNYNLEKFEFNPETLKKIIKSNILLYCVILVLVLRIAVVAVSINFPQNIFFADITKSVLLNLVNQTRESAGLPALAENQKLNQAAQLKAENMVQEQYFNHVSPTGVTPWFWFSKAEYNYKYAGENLAIGFFESEEVFNAWLNSPLHKDNLMNANYKEIGTAVLKGFGQNNAIIVVQLFGSQKAKVAQLEPVNVNNSLNVNVEEVSVENSVENSDVEKVLSQTTNYDRLLQDIVYGISLIVIGILLILIFSNIDFDFKRELVFRSVLILVLLFTAALANKDIILSFIPHQITIL